MPTRVLFSAFDPTNGAELWVTDGTAAGTHLLDDLNPGSGSSSPSHITDLGNGKAVFSAYDGTHGAELWVTDGTPAGTYLVDDIYPSGSSYPRNFAAIGNGKAVFSANDGTHGRELWVTDGTTAGTYMVDINPGLGTSNPGHFAALGNGKVLFSAYDSTHGFELWVTDGTAAGTHLVDDIYPGSGWSYPSDITELVDGKALFTANDGTHGKEVWVSDGTAAGTHLLDDINPGSNWSYPSEITALGNGKAVFSATDGAHGLDLWVTDGTAAGTYMVDINPGSGSPNPSDITELGNGKAVFSANDGTHGRELWVTDGTAAGTHLLDDIAPGSGSSEPGYFAALGNGQAMFSANDGTHGRELWVTDGSAAGTHLVDDVYPGSGWSSSRGFTALPQLVLFSANDSTHGGELWVSDGTAAGTHLVDDINPGSGWSYPSNFSVLVACYCRGTLILTETGEVRIEELAIGDRIMTASGEARAIRWIGRRAYDGRFIAGHRETLPIRIAAGALADGVPSRDLSVSPGHSLYIDGVLVLAEHLINGATIVQADHVDSVEYFHIELDTHDILVADGAPAESYVDCDNRLMFANGAEYARLYPQDDRPGWTFCAPRLEWGADELTAIRAVVLERAEHQGHPVALDPELHLVVDGAVVRPDSVAGGLYRFTVPAGSTAVWLASRDTVPAELVAASRDIRRLGVPVERLVLGDGETVVEAWHGHGLLRDGFHDNEATHRWTNGRARIPERLLHPFIGTLTVDVHLSQSELGYRLAAPEPIAAAA